MQIDSGYTYRSSGPWHGKKELNGAETIERRKREKTEKKPDPDPKSISSWPPHALAATRLLATRFVETWMDARLGARRQEHVTDGQVNICWAARVATASATFRGWLRVWIAADVRWRWRFAAGDGRRARRGGRPSGANFRRPPAGLSPTDGQHCPICISLSKPTSPGGFGVLGYGAGTYFPFPNLPHIPFPITKQGFKLILLISLSHVTFPIIQTPPYWILFFFSCTVLALGEHYD